MFRLLTTIVILVFISSSAWAVCKRKDIKGLYLAYATGMDNTGFNAVVCGLRISSKGRIDSGTSCISDVTNPIKGGRLTLGRDCSVTGVIETDDGDIRIPLASMDRDKSTISGVYLDRRGEGGFTAVKHKKISGVSQSMARYFGE